MALQEVSTLQFQDRPFFLPFILKQPPYINGGTSAFEAIRPLENLRNKYYIREQAQLIARTNPPVKAAISPVTLNQSGMGSTYRLSDELLRQYSLGTYLHNMGATFYQTRP
jgi:hypothetical protein